MRMATSGMVRRRIGYRSVGDHDFRGTRTAPGFRPVGLGESRLLSVVENRGLARDSSRGDHALSTESGNP